MLPNIGRLILKKLCIERVGMGGGRVNINKYRKTMAQIKLHKRETPRKFVNTIGTIEG